MFISANRKQRCPLLSSLASHLMEIFTYQFITYDAVDPTCSNFMKKVCRQEQIYFVLVMLWIKLKTLGVLASTHTLTELYPQLRFTHIVI